MESSELYETATYSEIQSWQAHYGEITDLDFSDDGKLIISASLGNFRGDGFVRAWGIWP